MLKTEAKIEAKIRELLEARGEGKTICPSEVARSLFSDSPTSDAWREHMDEVREAAFRLVVTGYLEITQRGRTVDVSNVAASKIKGPIRLRRAR